MNKFLATACAAVCVVGALKTALVAQFLLSDAQQSTAMITSLFAFFTGLTAIVAYVAFLRFRAYFEAQRKTRLQPGEGEMASKEAVISRYRIEWGLSQAESDVALFVAKGFSNAEIADMRGCAIATVKSQLGSIYQKSGLETRYQMMAFVTDEVCAMARAAGRPIDDADCAVTELTPKAIKPATLRAAETPPSRTSSMPSLVARAG